MATCVVSKGAVVAAAVLVAGMAGAAETKPFALTTEYRENPVGIDAPSPRLGWKNPSGGQTAYELEIDGKSFGRTESPRSVNVAWPAGMPTTSQRVSWRVRTWNAKGEVSDWSPAATFVAGVMRSEDWRAKWIGPAACTQPDFDFGAAQWLLADLPPNGTGVTFRTSFVWDGARPNGRPVRFAHAATRGHVVFVNGQLFHKPPEEFLDCRYPYFRDLTPYLVKGTNTIEATVLKNTVRLLSSPSDEYAFLGRIDFADGRTLVTDGDWTGGRTAGTVKGTAFGQTLILRRENASPAFEKTFAVRQGLVRATLHVTAPGFYEAQIDGRKIGAKVLDPSPTDYTKRILYSTYELEKSLSVGEHALRLLVGHGWYDMRSLSVWNFREAPWRDAPCALAQLELVYADGTTDVVASDGTWRQVKSPVIYDDIREGELYGEWEQRGPDFTTTELFAQEVKGPAGRLAAEAQPGAEVRRTLAPSFVRETAPGSWLIGFPENMAGWIRMKIRGAKKGDGIRITYSQLASGHGGTDCLLRHGASQDFMPFALGFQTDFVVASGDPVESYEPRFSYNGFQYVQVTGLRETPKAEEIEACIVATAFPDAGDFACSDANFTETVRMTERAYVSNFTDGIPTDCPHREKLGWLCDAATVSEFAQYRYENTAGYEKWLRDIVDSQLPSGQYPVIVPSSGWGGQGFGLAGPTWNSGFPILAWTLVAYRDDTAIARETFPAVRRYLDYEWGRSTKGYITFGYWDWIPWKSMTPQDFTATAYLYLSLELGSRLARVAGEESAAAELAARAATTRETFNARFHRGNGRYDEGYVTEQAVPLAFGLVPDDCKAAAQAELVNAVERAGRVADVGLLGAKHLFRMLSEAGRTDLAYDLLTRPEAPSPECWRRRGGTTLFEGWRSDCGNHVMFGDFACWAYQYLAGIRLPKGEKGLVSYPDPERRGFAQVLLAPVPIARLAWARAHVDTPYGRLASSWNRQPDGRITYEFTVPPGTEATIRVPGMPERRVTAGKHTMVSNSCITGGWPVAPECVRSGVSPALAMSVPQADASVPLATQLEARVCVMTASPGADFSSLQAGGAFIAR